MVNKVRNLIPISQNISRTFSNSHSNTNFCHCRLKIAIYNLYCSSHLEAESDSLPLECSVILVTCFTVLPPEPLRLIARKPATSSRLLETRCGFLSYCVRNLATLRPCAGEITAHVTADNPAGSNLSSILKWPKSEEARPV